MKIFKLYDDEIIYSILYDNKLYNCNIDDINKINIPMDIRNYINKNLYSIYETDNKPDLCINSYFNNGKYIYSMSLYDVLTYIKFDVPWVKELKKSIINFPQILTLHHNKNRVDKLGYQLYGEDDYSINILTDLNKLTNKMIRFMSEYKADKDIIGNLFTISARLSISYNDILKIQTITDKPLNNFSLDTRNNVIKIDDNNTVSNDYKLLSASISKVNPMCANRYMLNIITMTFTINDWCKILANINNDKSAVHEIMYFINKNDILKYYFWGC